MVEEGWGGRRDASWWEAEAVDWDWRWRGRMGEVRLAEERMLWLEAEVDPWWFESEALWEEAGTGRVRQRSLISRSSKSLQIGMMRSSESDQITSTRSSRWGGWVSMGNGENGVMAHDKCGALLLVGRGQEEDRLQDLDACVGVDVDRLVFWGAVWRGQS
jgi:hypothetical protein